MRNVKIVNYLRRNDKGFSIEDIRAKMLNWQHLILNYKPSFFNNNLQITVWKDNWEYFFIIMNLWKKGSQSYIAESYQSTLKNLIYELQETLRTIEKNEKERRKDKDLYLLDELIRENKFNIEIEEKKEKKDLNEKTFKEFEKKLGVNLLDYWIWYNKEEGFLQADFTWKRNRWSEAYEYHKDEIMKINNYLKKIYDEFDTIKWKKYEKKYFTKDLFKNRDYDEYEQSVIIWIKWK